jgi:hypothetical protein
LFLKRLGETEERDIGAELVVGDTYSALERPQVSPDGRVIAVEGLRLEDEGAELLLLDANGLLQDTISEGYWTRPLAWNPQGDLFYLSTACQSSLAQQYTLFRRSTDGDDRTIAQGTTSGAIGDATATADGLAYATSAAAVPGMGARGILALQVDTELWFWNLDEDARDAINTSERAITHVISP